MKGYTRNPDNLGSKVDTPGPSFNFSIVGSLGVLSFEDGLPSGIIISQPPRQSFGLPPTLETYILVEYIKRCLSDGQ